jgi:hypothetical protein
MRFGVSCDANIESGFDKVMFGMNKAFHVFFGDRFYDDSGIEMFVVLMCRDPRWNFKQRIRFEKKRNCLYMDLMFNLPTMERADMSMRKKIVAEKMIDEIPQIIAKYKFKGFDLMKFSADLRNWFEDHGWIDRELESWPADLTENSVK